MRGLGTIVGQPRTIEVLRAAVVAGKVHHGYLFDGPDGVGKATAARALAMALNCDERDPLGCGRCVACAKIDSGNHPDVLWFDMTPKGLTERVRELIGLVGFRPHEGRARVVIFDPAAGLAGPQDQCAPANVLLKTLEEPPADTHFVLVTSEAKRLPITVRSRCQRIRFQPLDDGTLEQLLIDRFSASPSAARSAAAQAAGSIGRALAELEPPDGKEGEDGAPRSRTIVESLLKAARKNDPRSIFDAASELGGAREEAEAACGYLWTVLRDALLQREQLAAGRVSPARADFAAQLVGDSATSSLLGALAATHEATLALRGNVAPALALEHLMLRIARARAA